MANTHPLVLTIDEFKQNLPLDKADILVDLGKAERFAEAHIPGALNVTPAATQAGPPVPGLIPNDEALAKLFSGLGLTPESHIFVYDDEGGGWAGRFIWILDEIGHTNYSFIDGGLPSWTAAGYPTTAEVQEVEVSNVQPKASGEFTVSLSDVEASLDNPDICVWDARGPLEYSGEKVNAARGGHIPGAINLNWTDLMDAENNLRLKPLDELRGTLNELGLDAAKTIYTHCQTHHRSGLSYLLMKILGYTNYKAYAGSWGEWGNQSDTPIEH